MNNPKTIGLIIFLHLFTFTNSNNVSQFFEESACSKCECYRVKCSRLNDNTSCKDEFWGTCDNRIDILEDSSDCNSKCDCCLNHGCFSWKTYQCIMYRSMFFSALFYMFMIVIMFYSIEKLYLLMFNVNYFEHANKVQKLRQENNDDNASKSDLQLDSDPQDDEEEDEDDVQDNMQERVHNFIMNKINRYDLDLNRVKIDCPYNKFLYIRPNNDTYKDSKYFFFINF